MNELYGSRIIKMDETRLEILPRNLPDVFTAIICHSFTLGSRLVSGVTQRASIPPLREAEPLAKKLDDARFGLPGWSVRVVVA